MQAPNGPGFQYCLDNAGGASAIAAATGTNYTTGASNADDLAVAVLAALAADCHWLIVGFAGTSASTEDQSSLADILYDPTGGTSWSALINDLITGFAATPTAGAISMPIWYHFPIWIPAGSTLGVRARHTSANTNTNSRVYMTVYGKPKYPENWWCGQVVESLGINASTSKGTSVTPGNSSAFGSFTTIGTSSRRYQALQVGLQPSSGVVTAIGYNWQIGVSSAQLPGTPTIYSSNNTTEQIWRVGPHGPMWVDVPGSTIIQMRGAASGTAQAHNCAIYGVS